MPEGTELPAARFSCMALEMLVRPDRMRDLAAQMRGYARDTRQDDYRRKFERVAEELERSAQLLEHKGTA